MAAGDGWDRAGRQVEHAVVLVIGAAIAAGATVGACIGFGVEKLRHRHRQT